MTGPQDEELPNWTTPRLVCVGPLGAILGLILACISAVDDLSQLLLCDTGLIETKIYPYRSFLALYEAILELFWGSYWCALALWMVSVNCCAATLD